MSNHAQPEPIRREVTVPASAERAFSIFIDEFADWWPGEYTWSGPVLEDIGIGRGVGGMCYEKGPHGFQCHWGRVLVWEPPQRLVLSWQISPQRIPEPDPERASEVEVRFHSEAASTTRVELEHREFERHGAGAEDYRAGMATPQGWTLILDRYRERVESRGGAEF